MAVKSLGSIEREVVTRVIENYCSTGGEITYESIVSGRDYRLIVDSMDATAIAADVHNSFLEKRFRVRIPKVPSVQMVSLILKECKDIALVRFNESAEPNLAFRIRNRASEYDNVWCLVETSKFSNGFDTMIIKLNEEADSKFRKEVKERLKIELTNENKVRTALVDGINIPCKNGVFNRQTKTFISWYDPSFDDVYKGYAFTFKLKVNYNPNATNVVLTSEKDGTPHEAWDFETHLTTLFDNNTPEKCALYKKAFWELAAHVISGYSQGYGFFWVNASGLGKGASGKSTLLVALRAIIGETDVCNNSINSLCSDAYAFSQIIGKVAVLSDETDESVSMISNYENLKKMLTNESINVREIYKQPVFFTPKLTLVQCTNQVPRFKGASESLFRRLRIIEFTKSFATDKSERQYIKNDYMRRMEILEYILRKIVEEVEIKYSEDVLEATSAKQSIMEYSFPVMQFMDELTASYPVIADLDIIPAPLLFDMFSNWFEMTNHTKTCLSAQSFWRQLASWVDNNSDWECVGGVHKVSQLINYTALNVNVFHDYPTNAQKRTWTDMDMNGVLKYSPSVRTFRNGIRFVSVPPRNTQKFLKDVVLKDETGEWHKEYEVFKQLHIDNQLRTKPISFERWVECGCLNVFDTKDYEFKRVEQEGMTKISYIPLSAKWAKYQR